MSKFTLDANPTFKAKVSIPIPGDKVAQVEFIFKHRTKDGFAEFIAGLEGKSDSDVIMEIASGWELADPFDKASIDKMIQNYMGSTTAMVETYIKELTAAKLGN